MLYLIGLGLSDETDITVKGLDIVKKASRVYLEAYTSILLVDKAVLVNTLGPTAMLELTLIYSRRPTMDGKSLLRIVRWWSLPVMRS
jgi:diphthamide biosynthesis methyltransferase